MSGSRSVDGSVDTVGVVGLGQVGLPLALEFEAAGYDVVGVDIDETRVDMLNEGSSYIHDVPAGDVADAVAAGLKPTTAFEALESASFVAVCVPTPLQKTGKPDITHVESAAERLAAVVGEGCTIILESTVYPGGTREIIAESFEKQGHIVGEDVFVAFSPERVNPGDERYDLTDIPKVLGGITLACGDRAQAFYERIFDTIHRVDSTTEAEMTKILENAFRSVNIALVNELARVANELDADIWNVVEAAETKPFGFMAFYPGPGLGGHCIPVDPLYLSWKASQHGHETELIDTADRINREMPEYVVYRIIDQLGSLGVETADADVHVVGVTYKPDVPDTRESPAFDIISLLERRGATVTYSDPYIESIEVEGHIYDAVDPTAKHLGNQDLVVIVTPHEACDLEHLRVHSPLLFDLKNVTRSFDDDHVTRL